MDYVAHRGMILAELGNYTEASQVANAALVVAPDAPNALSYICRTP